MKSLPFLLLFISFQAYAQKSKITCAEKDRISSDFTFNNTDCSIYLFSWTENNNMAVRSFRWDFGDGTSSAKSATEHMYQNGTFNVQLIVNGKQGCSDTTIKVVTINKPKADFTYLQNEPGKVQFFSKNGKLLHNWDFGDGSIAAEENPVHSYMKDGIYTVEMFVQNTSGCIDIIYKPVSITLPEKFNLGLKTPVAPIEKRSNNLIKEISVEQDSVRVILYDNGEIDGDSVTLIYNDAVLASKKLLTATPIEFTIKMDPVKEKNELIMYAENLGSIPPNTALMIIHDGNKRYEINVSSTKVSNGVVSFKRKR